MIKDLVVIRPGTVLAEGSAVPPYTIWEGNPGEIASLLPVPTVWTDDDRPYGRHPAGDMARNRRSQVQGLLPALPICIEGTTRRDTTRHDRYHRYPAHHTSRQCSCNRTLASMNNDYSLPGSSFTGSISTLDGRLLPPILHKVEMLSFFPTRGTPLPTVPVLPGLS